MDTNITNSFSKFPFDFQKDFFKKIAEIIKSGNSVQIAGAPGAGSSLLLNILDQTPNIKEKYFGQNNKYIFVLFDGDRLLDLSPISATRVLLSKLSPEVIDANESEILTQLENKINQICKDKKIIVMIDHLHKLNTEILQRFFTNLYTLFRNNEENFSFIFTVDMPLTNDYDLKNYSLLSRPITENILTMPPLNRSDSLWFVEEKEKQLGITLQDADKMKIFEMTGGFPRTLRRVVETLGKGIKLTEIEINPGVDANLRDHLNELVEYKQILGKMPILEIYLANKTAISNSEDIEGIQLKTKLTRNEERILRFLHNKMNEIQKRDTGIQVLWGENAIHISDHAYDQIIHRLKNKLKGSVPTVTIETVRGRGHVLKIDK